MKYFALISTAMLLVVAVQCQEIKVSPGDELPFKKVTVLLPDKAPAASTPVLLTLRKPCTGVFLEYGDGEFTNSFNSQHAFIKNPADAIANFSVFYDTTKLPREFYSRQLAVTDAEESNRLRNRQNILGNLPQAAAAGMAARNIIAITPSISSICSGDTMVFVVTYTSKLPGKIFFLYNNSRAVFFEKVPLNNGSIRRYLNSGQNDITQPPENDALEAYGDNPVVRDYRQTKQLFEQGISIPVPAANLVEKNVFITMVPRKLLSDSLKKYQAEGFDNLETNIKAYFFPDGGPDSFGVTQSSIPLLYVHDPNWLNGYPECVDKKKITGQEFTYKLHFQNTGNSPVTDVKAKIYLPDIFDPGSIQIVSLHSAGNRVIVNDSTVQLVAIAERLDKAAWQRELNLKNSAVSSGGFIQQVNMRMSQSPLRGTNEPEYANNPVKTVAELTIKVKVKPFYSRAAINSFFANNTGIHALAKIQFEGELDGKWIETNVETLSFKNSFLCKTGYYPMCIFQ